MKQTHGCVVSTSLSTPAEPGRGVKIAGVQIGFRAGALAGALDAESMSELLLARDREPVAVPVRRDPYQHSRIHVPAARIA